MHRAANLMRSINCADTTFDSFSVYMNNFVACAIKNTSIHPGCFLPAIRNPLEVFSVAILTFTTALFYVGLPKCLCLIRASVLFPTVKCHLFIPMLWASMIFVKVIANRSKSCAKSMNCSCDAMWNAKRTKKQRKKLWDV